MSITNELGELVRAEMVQGTEIEFQMTPCRQYSTRVRAVDGLTRLESEEVVSEKLGESRSKKFSF